MNHAQSGPAATRFNEGQHQRTGKAGSAVFTGL
jgi:hypothetical protein